MFHHRLGVRAEQSSLYDSQFREVDHSVLLACASVKGNTKKSYQYLSNIKEESKSSFLRESEITSEARDVLIAAIRDGTEEEYC